jgi:hypothetical protein
MPMISDSPPSEAPTTMEAAEPGLGVEELGISVPTNQSASDACVIWEVKSTVDAFISRLGITGLTTSVKADGSTLIKGANTCIYAMQRGVNMACVGEEQYQVGGGHQPQP